MLSLAVYPGCSSGAYALLSASGELIALEDLPFRPRWGDVLPILPRLKRLIADHPTRAVVQKARVQRGVATAYDAGAFLGALCVGLQLLSCSVRVVSATKWRHHASDGSLPPVDFDYVQRLYPQIRLEPTQHNRALVLLLADWARKRGAD